MAYFPRQIRVKRPITSKDGGKRKRLRKGDEGRIKANKSEDLHKQLFGDEEDNLDTDKQVAREREVF